MRGIVIFQIPDSLLQAFVQHVRDFDTRTPEPTIFEIFMETEHTVEEIKAALDGIKPGFPFMRDFKWKP